MAEPILKDRAQKYGRNVLFAAGVILVLDYVPGISIDKFKPLGFKFDPTSDSEFYLWCLLAFGLGYYFVRFLVDASADYLKRGPDEKDYFRDRKRLKKQIENVVQGK